VAEELKELKKMCLGLVAELFRILQPLVAGPEGNWSKMGEAERELVPLLL
jgi:hypothetical protein